VVGATEVVPPGDKRDYWLVHTVFDRTAQRFRVVVVTGRRGPERLARGGVRPGEIYIADRGHAHADDLALVIAGGADFLGAPPPTILACRSYRIACRPAYLMPAGDAGEADRPPGGGDLDPMSLSQRGVARL
jgi:hypothetical protein